MAKIKGICRNEDCEMCDQIQEAEKSNFKCEKCGKDLIPFGNKTSEPGGGPNKKLIGIIAGFVVLLAIIGVIAFSGGSPKVENLTIDKTNVTFKPDQTERLNVTIEPNGVKAELVWQSSDENIVSVMDGVITGKKAGKATVKVFVKDQEGISAACECIVIKNDVDLETLDIVEDPVTLRPGGHQQLTVKCTPDDQNETISWSSSDETVAKVSPRGKVEAIKVGQVFIIAKSDRTGVADTARVSVDGPAEMLEGNAGVTKVTTPAPTPTPKVVSTPKVVPTPKSPTPTQSKTTKQPTPATKPAKPVPSGSMNLGYATFKGSWPNDVNGRMIFKSSHAIDSKDPKKRVADAGDYVIGEWVDGHLVQGIWYGSDNQVKGSVIIGR